jgi:hypothetical protein
LTSERFHRIPAKKVEDLMVDVLGWYSRVNIRQL